jgi:parallel beta-helix repeat protein
MGRRHLVLGLIIAAFAVVGDIDGAPAEAGAAIRNVATDRSFDTLGEALAAARDNETIEISGGPYVGNFIIDKTITLRGVTEGQDGTVLDGNKAGTVLTITAPGVVVENIAVVSSATEADLFLHWGYAGVRLEADAVTLRDLYVAGNDWGILMFAGKGSTVENSTIEDNARDGIKIMGGREHRIIGNTINRNANGIFVDVLHTQPRSPLARLEDPTAAAEMALEKETAPRSEDILISGNEVRGNANIGIGVTWHSSRIVIENNFVHLTGVERKPDLAAIETVEKTITAGLGSQAVAVVNRESIGSGIYLFCLVENNRVAMNRSFDNLGSGIILQIADNNEIARNSSASNRVGISLESSNTNRIEKNTVFANTDFGIRIGGQNPLAAASAENLVTMNDLAENGVNAFDSSSRMPTPDDLAGIIDTMPYPDTVKKQLRENPSMRNAMLQSMAAQLKPATNRWDDGTDGNRHDDFDEPNEGFVDRDTDGTSEVAHPINGGSSVDRYPLDEATVKRLLVM